MAGISADFFDGRSSRRRQVTIAVKDGKVTVSGDGMAFEVPVAEVKISARMSGMPRRLEFPGGAAAVVHDNEAVDRAFAVAVRKTLAHRLESHAGIVVAALILTIALCWSGYQYGVPWAAREAAMRLPANLESSIAEEGLKALDELLFRPSTLNARHRAALAQTFAALRDASGLPVSVRLELRDGKLIGANALALPGGIVVVTDPLARLLGDEDQIAAVLAHELGHIQHRHSLRYILQDSIVALAAMAIYGDASAVAGIAATVPTALVHARYSQGFEREADEYAYELLRKTGRSPRALGLALSALEAGAENGGESNARDKSDAEGGGVNDTGKRPRARDFGYLSTHPSTRERVQAAEAAAR
ncbi:MAG: M48 family metallopeptidase [Pseudomonadota bacterium]